ncbi:hypothetical protein [Paenibacillus polymyxa]|nr:hypothetical protein [Paenibacillus polymyxa]UZP70027.1 hypothetical protein MF622_07390 [Paenibacillus polymyxa]
MNAHKIDVSGAVLRSAHGFRYTYVANNARFEKFGPKASGTDW